MHVKSLVDARDRTMYGLCSIIAAHRTVGRAPTPMIPTANGGPIMHAAVQHVEAMSAQIVGYLDDLARIPTLLS